MKLVVAHGPRAVHITLSDRQAWSLVNIADATHLVVGNFRSQEPHTYVPSQTFTALRDRGLVDSFWRGQSEHARKYAFLTPLGERAASMARRRLVMRRPCPICMHHDWTACQCTAVEQRDRLSLILEDAVEELYGVDDEDNREDPTSFTDAMGRFLDARADDRARRNKGEG